MNEEMEDRLDSEVADYSSVDVPVTSITINGPRTLIVGETVQLTATISPSNASDTSVTWSIASNSYDPSALTLTNDGKVTLNHIAMFAMAGVTCTANDGSGISASYWPYMYDYAYLLYDANGGNGAPNTQKSSEASYSTTCSFTISNTEPTRSGYSFLGWNTSSSASSASYMPGETIDGKYGQTTTLYAVWQQVGAVTSISVDSVIGLWSGNSKTITATTSPTSASNRGVTFSLSSTKGGYISSQSATSTGGTCTLKANTIAETYSATLTVASSDGAVTETVTVYFYCYEFTATLSYNTNGGSGSFSNQSDTVYLSTEDSPGSHTFTISSARPTRSGYTFLGWSTSSSASTASYQPSGEISVDYGSTRIRGSDGNTETLYAVWKEITYYNYNVYYNANGGTGAPSTQTYTRTDTTSSFSVTLSSTKPTRSGYSFEGWAESSNATVATKQPGSTATLTYSDLRFYAVWSAYTVTYDGNGGTPAKTSDSGVVTLPSASRSSTTGSATGGYTTTSYTMLGWSTSSSATSASYTVESSYTPTSNVTLYAVWSSSKTTTYYTVTFDGNGGTPAKTSDSGVVTLPTATLDHYGLSGWYTAASGGTSVGTAGDTYTPTANITLYAHWKASTYSVVLIDRGYTVQTQTVTIGDTCSPPSRTWEGYTLLGWSASSSATSAEYSASGFTPASDLTVYAVWTRTVTLSYDANGGTGAPASQASTWTGTGGINSSNLNPGMGTWSLENASIIDDSTTDSGKAIQYNAGTSSTSLARTAEITTPVAGHVYYGAYKVKTDGTLTGKDNRTEVFNGDGTGLNWVIGSNTGTYSDWTLKSKVWTASTVAKTSGYYIRAFVVHPNVQFWITDLVVVDLTAKYGAGNEPAKEWCDANIGYLDAPRGATFKVIDTKPTRTNYDFLGWSTDKDATVSAYDAGGSISVTGDTKLYAVWKLITWKVSFDSNAGSSVASQTITNGQSAVAPTNPTLEGYSFQGWYTDKGLTTAYDFSTAVTSDITLYAKWVGILAFTTVPTVSTNFASVAPSAYTFSAVGSYGSSFHWDFGDGQSADGIYATHWYERDGDYTVTLTAYNAYGESATDTFTVSTSSGDAGSDHHDDDHTLALAALGVVGAIVLVSVVRRFV